MGRGRVIWLIFARCDELLLLAFPYLLSNMIKGMNSPSYVPPAHVSYLGKHA